jgi:hypothetical protein
MSDTLTEKQKPKTPKEIKRRLAEIEREMSKLDGRLTELYNEDRSDYAQNIIDKMFNEFKKGKRWLEKMQEQVRKEYYSYSPNGRVRHLYGMMYPDRENQGSQERRGINAPIQGFASEVGVAADRLIVYTYYKELPKLKKMLGIKDSTWKKFRIKCSRAVHDALYKQVPYEFVIPFIHILQYQATYGVADKYYREFKLKFSVEPEIEVGIGASADNESDWDWSIPNLIQILLKTIDDIEALGQLEGTKEEVIEKVFAPWYNKKVRQYLQDKYPILGVKDLDNQIVEALKVLKVLKNEPD